MSSVKSIFRINLVLCFTIIGSIQAISQEKFQVYGKMKLEKGSLDGRIELFENGSRKSVRKVDGTGKFDFGLELNKDYVISFSQEGYVTKKIALNTTVADDRAELGFAPFQFQVTLFKQYEGVNFVVFNQPVGKIKYNEEVEDFDYDTDYTKSIQQRLQEVQKEVEKKSKEEDKEAKKKPEKEDPPKTVPPMIKEETSVKREDPPTTPRRRTPTPPPPPPKRKTANVVVLQAYTVGYMGYPNLHAYGFINFGDGAGRREITKEQFEEYAKTYR